MHAPISNLNKFLTQILLVQIIHYLPVITTNRHCILCALQIPHCFNCICCDADMLRCILMVCVFF